MSNSTNKDIETVANQSRWPELVWKIYNNIYLRWSPVPIVMVSSYYLYSHATGGGGMSQYHACVCIMWLFIALFNMYSYQSNIKVRIFKDAEKAYKLASSVIRDLRELAYMYAQLKETSRCTQCDCLDTTSDDPSGESVH